MLALVLENRLATKMQIKRATNHLVEHNCSSHRGSECPLMATPPRPRYRLKFPQEDFADNNSLNPRPRRCLRGHSIASLPQPIPLARLFVSTRPTLFSHPRPYFLLMLGLAP